jgi:hypothetical protein
LQQRTSSLLARTDESRDREKGRAWLADYNGIEQLRFRQQCSR